MSRNYYLVHFSVNEARRLSSGVANAGLARGFPDFAYGRRVNKAHDAVSWSRYRLRSRRARKKKETFPAAEFIFVCGWTRKQQLPETSRVPPTPSLSQSDGRARPLGTRVWPKRLENSIVAALPRERFPGLQHVVLTLGEVLQAPGRPIRHVYFPTGALVSLFAETHVEGDISVEVALIGSEGMVGASIVLGDRTARTRALVQASGTAMRANAGDFLQALEQTAGLRRRALRYSSELAFLFIQSAACSRNHTTQQRLARWLLMARERLGSQDIQFSQQFIARALSVRRTGVSEAAVTLKRMGLIHYRRGVVEILDEPRLRATSCPCVSRPARGVR